MEAIAEQSKTATMFLVPAKRLITMLKTVKDALSDDLTRYALTHAEVTYSVGEGKRIVTMIATDGHRMHRVEWTDNAGEESGPFKVTGYLSADDIALLLAQAKIAKKQNGKFATVAVAPKLFTNGERYPADVDRLFPAKLERADANGVRLMGFNPTYIAEAMPAAGASAAAAGFRRPDRVSAARRRRWRSVAPPAPDAAASALPRWSPRTAPPAPPGCSRPAAATSRRRW